MKKKKNEINLKIDMNHAITILLGVLLITGSFVIFKNLLFPMASLILQLIKSIISMYPSLNINVQFASLILLGYCLFSVLCVIGNLIIKTWDWYLKLDLNKKEEMKK